MRVVDHDARAKRVRDLDDLWQRAHVTVDPVDAFDDDEDATVAAFLARLFQNTSEMRSVVVPKRRPARTGQAHALEDAVVHLLVCHDQVTSRAQGRDGASVCGMSGRIEHARAGADELGQLPLELAVQIGCAGDERHRGAARTVFAEGATGRLDDIQPLRHT